jgi:hypothetical protein
MQSPTTICAWDAASDERGGAGSLGSLGPDSEGEVETLPRAAGRGVAASACTVVGAEL